MAERIQNEYMPDIVSPPGDTLAEALEALGMTQKELAERTGLSKKTVNLIIKAKAPITPETALYLERALGVPARFWNTREQHYREYLARAEEQNQLGRMTDWLRKVPVRQMVTLGWIAPAKDRVQQLQEVLSFFGVTSPDAWNDVWMSAGAAYRQSTVFESEPVAVAAWLRRGELMAQVFECGPYSETGFREVLPRIRRMTRESPDTWATALRDACSPCGVAVVLVPELARIRVSGAARWLSPSKALIQLNLRYKSDDQFWFTFFHEAGHILLHGKRDVFVDGDKEESPCESQADGLAQDMLIPPRQYEAFLSKGRPSREGIRAFARRQGIAPGIVVGRLQHDTGEYSRWNDLKVRVEWSPGA
jgi:HTH-type transcriptional regulator/antitoxin HigA